MKAKICGVTTLEDAKIALENHADFIGLIFCKKSKRYVDESLAKNILSEIESKGGAIVGVFLDEPIQEIARLAKQLNLKWVQLLAPKTPEELTPLEHLQKFLVIQVKDQGQYEPRDYPHKKGYWLYDGVHAGSGKPFNWDHFYPKERGPFFIAGGLTPLNLLSIQKCFEPDGVDVATGVCLSDGIKKDAEKVQEFIERAHNA